MRYRTNITGTFNGEGAIFELKKLLMLLGVIASSLSLGISVAHAQNNRPIDIDKMPAGPPAIVELPNGIKKYVYKNQAQQVFKIELQDGPRQIGEYNVNKIYPNGQVAEDTSSSAGGPRDKYISIDRQVKYDSAGNLIKTSETTRFIEPIAKQIKNTTYNGAFPSNETTTTIDKNGTKVEECKDFGGKYGFNTKIVTQNGQTRTYVRDENGNWVPKEDKNPGPPKPNPPKPQPPKPNPPPKPAPENKVENQGDMRCLAGTWHSTAAEPLSGFRGAEGIILTVKANGETTVNYSLTLKSTTPGPNAPVEKTMKYSGREARRLRLRGTR